MISKLLLFSKKLPTTFFILFCIYIVAYIASPYWLIPNSRVEKIVLLFLLLICGFLWAILSSRQCEFGVSKKDAFLFALAALAALLINARTIQSAIPWRGDEDLHIGRVLRTIGLIHPELILAFAFLFGFVVWLAHGNRSLWSGFLILGVVITIIVLEIAYKPFIKLPDGFFLRYPFFSYWLYSIFPGLMSFVGSEYFEPLFRIIPLLSAAGIAWIFSRNLPGFSKWGKFIWIIAIISMPVLFYYSSIFYLEILAVLLMCLVTNDIKNIICSEWTEIRYLPAWYALIIIGFIKETTVVFLFLVITFRWIYRGIKFLQHHLRNKKAFHGLSWKTFIVTILLELLNSLAIIIPLLIYLFLRSSLGEVGRQYSLQFQNLLIFDTYKTLLQALYDQFGIFILLWLAGVMILVHQQKKLKAAFLISLGLLVPLFYAADEWLYIGYSRFNLFMLPAVLAGASSFLGWLATKQKNGAIFVMVITILANVFITPINWDGTKKPFWGNYNYDTSEHYYPYPEAFSLIKNKGEDRVLLSGLYYRYYYKFYLTKYNLNIKVQEIISPVNKIPSLDEAIEYALIKKYDAVIYHLPSANASSMTEVLSEKPDESLGFTTTPICNMAHCLLVLIR